jgi:hypothetical protein
VESVIGANEAERGKQPLEEQDRHAAELERVVGRDRRNRGGGRGIGGD